MKLALFQQRTFMVGNLIALAFFSCNAGMAFVFTVFLPGCWATFESHVSRPGYADVLSSTGNLSQRRPSWIGKRAVPPKRR